SRIASSSDSPTALGITAPGILVPKHNRCAPPPSHVVPPISARGKRPPSESGRAKQ
ncbi:hypothetical protein KI387_014422, partial [Taxus chinensis]